MVARGVFLVLVMVLIASCGDRGTPQPDAEAAKQPPAAPAAPPQTIPSPPTLPVKRTCPVCQQPVSAEAKYCRACGSRQP